MTMVEEMQALLPRLGTPRDHRYPTFGPQVAEVARSLGLPLTPWQRYVADVSLEYELVDRPVYSEGVLIYTVKVPKFRYREVRLWVPRQSGKTVLLLALLTWRCLFAADLFYPEENFLGRTAQWTTFFSTHGTHAKHKWEDEHVPIMEAAEDLRGEFSIRRNNGHEAFLWTNNSIWNLGSSTEKAAHGDSMDMIAADEFFAQLDDRIENGARPTMITRRSPQMWFVSTFGDTKEGKISTLSEPLWKKVDDSRERCRRFLAGDTTAHGNVASFEYSAADFDDGKMDYGDREMWRRTMPGLECNGGIITEEAIQADFDSMTLAAFKRAYLNLRQPRGKIEVPALISPTLWSGVVDDDSVLQVGAKQLAIGLDVDAEDESASLMLVGPRLDKLRHIELIRHDDQSDWLMHDLATMLVHYPVRDVGMDVGGPAGRYLKEVEEICDRAKVKLHKYTGRSWAAACESFRQACVDATIRNNGSMSLAAAVDLGIKRAVADVWVWDRKSAIGGSLSPLCAATAGLRAHEEGKVKERKSAYDDENWEGQ